MRLDAATEALWALQSLMPGSSISNVAIAFDLDRQARWWPLQQAVNALIRRHAALRASFPSAEGLPVRHEHAEHELELDIDVHSTGPETVEADLREYAARPFDLDTAPLIRVGMFTVSPGHSVICVVAHHIVMDAASLRVLVREIVQAYQSVEEGRELLAGQPASPAALPAPSQAAMDFWRGHVAGFDPSGMRLDAAAPEDSGPDFTGEVVERVVPDDVMEVLAELRRACRSTDAMVLLAAYYLAVRRHGAARDALVGVMADTRGGTAADAVGYHIATVPLRVAVDDEMSFPELVQRVTRTMADAFEHGLMTYELVGRYVPESTAAPDWWRSGLVHHVFNFRGDQQAEARMGESSIGYRDVFIGLSRFDLDLAVERLGPRIIVKLHYRTRVFDRAFAESFLDRLLGVLRQAARRRSLPVAGFDLRTERDRRLIEEVNETGRQWQGPRTVLGMVIEAAGRTPDAVALSSPEGSVTYAELVRMAAAVRDQVRAHDGGPGSVVALAGPRGPGLAAAVLGVWAAGAAYLPLDAAHPARRLSFQLDDAACQLIIGDHRLPDECTRGRTVLTLPSAERVTGPLTEPEADAEAYLIYTSGSTGTPKGVWLSHGNLANVVRHFADLCDLGAGDGVLWLTTFAFDISALELCLPLSRGGRVVAAPDSALHSPDVLLETVAREDVAIVQATPTTWRQVAPHAAGLLVGRTLLCGGEPLTSALAGQLLATGATVYNVYGPTETTIWSTAAQVVDPASTAIGRPVANTRVHVVDGRLSPLPPGIVGELCVSGDGVAKGYHRLPDLTADRFRHDEELGRLYRTGDRALLRHDGTLILLGRADRQVKLRGHRVELGEVEAVLEGHPEVRAASVVLRGDPSADGVLAAFVAARDRRGLRADLWAYAADRLPSYCVPARLAVLPALPTTANGKIDTKALAGWPLEPAEAGEREPSTHRTAGDEIERGLVRLWREVLGRHDMDVDANFFLSGGHSLAAARLAELATRRLGTPVTMGMVFRAPTPARLAHLIEVPEGAR
ncbi:amino acid adenylation domain-containing protein [Nonomuraea purpurea]|uniref:Amino acid adenylation domain-containing protein n=1 Tax=Nonomuraea purpurea TaxID=1849276 RepID=A0ABV8GTR3_9ACTN